MAVEQKAQLTITQRENDLLNEFDANLMVTYRGWFHPAYSHSIKHMQRQTTRIMTGIRLERDLTVRPPGMADAAAVAGLINLCAMLETGALQTSVADVRAHWANALSDPDRDVWLVEGPDAVTLGYLEVLGGPAAQTPFVWAWLHPDYAVGPLGGELLTLVERHVRARRGVPVTLRTATINVNHATRRLLSQQGFHLAARYWSGQDGAALWPPLGLPMGLLPYRYDVYEKELCPAAVN